MKLRHLLSGLALAVLVLAPWRASAGGATSELNGSLTVTPSTTVAAAGATNSPASGSFANYRYRGLLLTVNITTLTGTAPTLTVAVQEYDALSNTYVALPGCTTAALAATGQTALLCYPGINVAANSTVSTVLPFQWRVVSTAGGTPTNITWTVGGQLLQ